MREQIIQEFTQHMVIHSLAFDAENFMRTQIEQFLNQMDDEELNYFIDNNRNKKLSRFWEKTAKAIGDEIYNRNKTNVLSNDNIKMIINNNLFTKLNSLAVTQENTSFA